MDEYPVPALEIIKDIIAPAAAGVIIAPLPPPPETMTCVFAVV